MYSNLIHRHILQILPIGCIQYLAYNYFGAAGCKILLTISNIYDDFKVITKQKVEVIQAATAVRHTKMKTEMLTHGCT